MRILQLYRDLHWGGIQSHVRALCRGLADAGHEVVFAGPTPSLLADQLSGVGVDCVDLPMRGLLDARSHWRLARLLRGGGFDLVHSHARRATFYATRAGRRARVPVVATAHTTNAWKSFDRADAVIAISDAVRGGLVSHGVEEARIAVIHHGIPAVGPDVLAGRRERRRTLGLADDDVAVALSGRFIPDKGHDVLIAALQGLAGRLPGMKVFLIGADDGEYCERIRTMVSDSGLDETVRFVPFQSEVMSLLAAMDVAVVPSRREGLSLSLLEAASLGLGLIGSRVGGIPEVIEDGVTGLLFESGDAEGLARCLTRLVDDAALRARVGSAAGRLVEEDFATSVMLARTQAVYRGCLAQR